MDKETRRSLRRARQALAKRGVRARVELRIAISCPVAWETMRPVAEGVRHCHSCEAKVHDLRGLSKGEILDRMRTHGAPLCAQVNARDDGRIVFGPCDASSELIRGMLVAD